MNDTKETYTVTPKCTNCGSQGPHEIEKGTLVSDATCANCGCKTLGTKQTLGDLIDKSKLNDYGPKQPLYPYKPNYIGDLPGSGRVLC